jgi:hypothetical protein
MNPVQMADVLKKTHGLEYAANMARGLSRLSRELLTLETPGLGEEVELAEYEEKGQKRVKFEIDEPKKAERLAKTMRYWMNVTAILNNYERKAEAAKQPKNKKH